MNSSTTVAPLHVSSHHVQEAPGYCEETPTTPQGVASLSWSESEGGDPASREVSIEDLRAFAEHEDLAVCQNARTPSVSTVPTPVLFDPFLMEDDEEAFLTEDDDIAELVAMTELGFTFQEISEKEEFFVRSDSPNTDRKTDQVYTAFPSGSNAARIVPQEHETNPEDKENKPPPKWSPARIARDLQLANPLFAHATSVAGLGGKASNSTLVRVPFADITVRCTTNLFCLPVSRTFCFLTCVFCFSNSQNVVIGEMEKKKDFVQKPNAPAKNGVSGSGVNAKKNKHRPALRMLR